MKSFDPAAARQEEGERRAGRADGEPGAAIAEVPDGDEVPEAAEGLEAAEVSGAADGPEAAEVPIDGTLDLHTFRPGEVKELVPEYLGACLERGIFEVRVVHGKGTGTLKRAVEAVLARDPRVESFRTAAEDGGGWGATLVTLKRG
jgi:DNA-nicking Smr family endonuclease